MTLLDYAWVQIEHDRNYKTAEELPKNSDIPRRFQLIASTLEILENEFERLANETEHYADVISNKMSKGDFEDIVISPFSLRKFLTFNFRDIPGFREYFMGFSVLDELDSMEIRTVAELNAIIPEGFKKKYKEVSKPKDFVTFTAIIRDILIIHNSVDYFKKAWKHHYNTFDYHCWKVYNRFNLDKRGFPPEDDLKYDEGSDDD
jgi:putative GTP pyrophosphokinase